MVYRLRQRSYGSCCCAFICFLSSCCGSGSQHSHNGYAYATKDRYVYLDPLHVPAGAKKGIIVFCYKIGRDNIQRMI